jgi:hypothetical protein
LDAISHLANELALGVRGGSMKSFLVKNQPWITLLGRLLLGGVLLVAGGLKGHQTN